jgi:hypothetical protein
MIASPCATTAACSDERQILAPRLTLLLQSQVIEHFTKARVVLGSGKRLFQASYRIMSPALLNQHIGEIALRSNKTGPEPYRLFELTGRLPQVTPLRFDNAQGVMREGRPFPVQMVSQCLTEIRFGGLGVACLKQHAGACEIGLAVIRFEPQGVGKIPSGGIGVALRCLGFTQHIVRRVKIRP